MLKEAIDRIVALAKPPASKFVYVPGDAPHVRWLIDPDGQAERIELTPGARSITFSTVADLIAATKHAAEDGHKPLVLYSLDKVRLIFDRDRMHDTGLLPLTPTREFRWFSDRHADPMVSPDDFYQALITTLYAAVADPKLMQKVNRIKVRTLAEAGSQHERTRESMGKSINAMIDSDEDLPAELQRFNVRLSTVADLAQRFPLIVRVDPELKAHQWLVRPLESNWLDYRDRNLHALGRTLSAELEGTGARIYSGDGYAQRAPEPMSAIQ